MPAGCHRRTRRVTASEPAHRDGAAHRRPAPPATAPLRLSSGAAQPGGAYPHISPPALQSRGQSARYPARLSLLLAPAPAATRTPLCRDLGGLELATPQLVTGTEFRGSRFSCARQHSRPIYRTVSLPVQVGVRVSAISYSYCHQLPTNDMGISYREQFLSCRTILFFLRVFLEISPNNYNF